MCEDPKTKKPSSSSSNNVKLWVVNLLFWAGSAFACNTWVHKGKWHCLGGTWVALAGTEIKVRVQVRGRVAVWQNMQTSATPHNPRDARDDALQTWQHTNSLDEASQQDVCETVLMPLHASTHPTNYVKSICSWVKLHIKWLKILKAMRH